MARKGKGAPIDSWTPAAPSEAEPADEVFKAKTFQLNNAAKTALARLAIDQDTTVSTLLRTAIADLFKKHGLDPTIVKEPPPPGRRWD